MNPRPGDPQLEAIADDALLLRIGDRIDPTINARVHALCERIRAQRPGWLRDLVPAYASIGVFFDPLKVEIDHVRQWLHDLADADLDGAAKKVIQPESLLWVVVGDRSKIESGIRELKMGELQLLDVDGQPVK